MTSAQTSMSAARNTSAAPSEPGRLDAWTGAIVFLAFAAAYFCSALVRAITATLSPVLTQDFSLHARDLGLLAGGYFLGFAATQLPLGTWLVADISQVESAHIELPLSDPTMPLLPLVPTLQLRSSA